MELIEMRIPVHCDGCERKLRKALSRMIGVETVDIDHEQQKVTVMGYVEKEKVLKKAKKTLTLAQYWPFGHYNVRYRRNHDYEHEHKVNRRRPIVQHWSHDRGYGYGEGFTQSRITHSSYDPYTANVHGQYGSGRSSYDHNYGYDQQYRHAVDDRNTIFSEDNPNSCSVM